MHAAEFALSDGSSHYVTAATASTAAVRGGGGGGASSVMKTDRKPRVCVAFYETAQCPYNNRCEHAHNFSELDGFTQERLLETVPFESIPKHFMLPLGVRERAAPSVSLTREAHSATCPPARGEKGTAVSQRSYRHATRMHERSSSNLCDNSISSLASSTGSTFIGSPQNSNNASPHRTQRREEGAEPFHIRLPARCRYPHRTTSGTYYDVLGVSRNATQEEILASYSRWQKEYKRMKQIDQQRVDAHDTLVVEARNVIGHPMLRAEYDRTVPNHCSTAAAIATTYGNTYSRDSMRAATVVSSAKPSRSVNLDTLGVYTNTMQVLKDASSVDTTVFTAAGPAVNGTC